VHAQIQAAIEKSKGAKLDTLIATGDVWTVS
jgi:hypothetical protein